MLKTQWLSILLTLCLSTVSGASFAKKYKCGCIDMVIPSGTDAGKSFKEVFENSSEVRDKFGNVECVKSEMFKQPGQSSVSIQEKNVKIYIEGKYQVRTDKQKQDNDMEIRFRPRNGKCMELIGDKYRGKRWQGAWCNRDKYKEQGGFAIKTNDGSMLTAHTALAVDVTGPNRYAAAIHWQWSKGNQKWLMTAACLENK